MAEQIANDPTFKDVTKQLTSTFGGLMGGQPGEAPNAVPANDPRAFDPARYMEAMSGMFQNPDFMKMAENLGRTIIEVSGALPEDGGRGSVTALPRQTPPRLVPRAQANLGRASA